jgi:fumarate reductase subunit C
MWGDKGEVVFRLAAYEVTTTSTWYGNHMHHEMYRFYVLRPLSGIPPVIVRTRPISGVAPLPH